MTLNANEVNQNNKNENCVLKYLDSPVGSGKTGLIVNRIKEAGGKSIISTPTRKLGEEIERRLTKEGISNVFRIISDSENDPVKQQIKEKISKLFNVKNAVLIITSEAFRKVVCELDWVYARQYDLYLDEGLEPYLYAELSETKLDQYAEHFEFSDDNEISIAVGSNQLLQDVACRPDKITNSFRERLLVPSFVSIAKIVTDPIYKVYAMKADQKISVLGLVDPEVLYKFKSVMIAAANYSNTVGYRIWRDVFDTKMEPLDSYYELFDTHDEKGRKLSVYHVLNSDDNASIETLKSCVETGKSLNPNDDATLMRKIFEDLDAELSNCGVKYCWNANDKFKKHFHLLNGKKMPVKSHGLNEWRDMDTVAALACCNSPKWIINLLCELINRKSASKTDASELYRMMRLEQNYQTVGRCSIRDRYNDNQISAIVLSRECAEDLSKLFPGSVNKGSLFDSVSIKSLRKASKKEGRICFDSSDNVAWHKYKKRNPASSLSKDTWYKEIRTTNKSNISVEGVSWLLSDSI